LVPLKDIVIKGTLNGTISTVNVQLGYVNSSEDQPIECTFDFSINSKSIVSSLSARIGDKLIEASIREKEEAKEKYDDAIAAGNAAILGEQSDKKKNCISLKLGNLLPYQEATINMVLIEEIEMIGSSFSYTLPASFYPDYNKHSTNKELKHTYALNYEYKIISGDKINYLSVPKAAQS
jgi:Ca-activated chloride channel family protein